MYVHVAHIVRMWSAFALNTHASPCNRIMGSLWKKVAFVTARGITIKSQLESTEILPGVNSAEASISSVLPIIADACTSARYICEFAWHA